jgi:Matrixin
MDKKIYSHGIGLFRVIALVVMSVITFVGIADAQVPGQVQQGITKKDTARFWTENNNVVPVCWLTDGYGREKEIVREAVRNTWEEFANITFTGWGKCSSPIAERNANGGTTLKYLDKYVRISVSHQGSGNGGAGGSARVGMAALDESPGMWMQFNSDGTAGEGRIQYIAVHEFGHVLGFVHEQDSPNHDRAHCAGGTEANSSSLTGYDPDSVMNYCNKDGNMKGNLTSKDIVGVRQVYGTRKVTIGDLLLMGKFRSQGQLDGMSDADRRNTLITELGNRTKDAVSYYQSLNNADLIGAGALLVFLRERPTRTDQELKTMSVNDMRNTAIVEVNKRMGRSIRDLQALSSMDVVRSVLTPKLPYIITGQVVIPNAFDPLASVALVWDGGPTHPNVEVFVSVNNGPDIPAFSANLGQGSPVFKLPKAGFEMKLPRRSGVYRYSLQAGGVTLAVTEPFVVP